MTTSIHVCHFMSAILVEEKTSLNHADIIQHLNHSLSILILSGFYLLKSIGNLKSGVVDSKKF